MGWFLLLRGRTAQPVLGNGARVGRVHGVHTPCSKVDSVVLVCKGEWKGYMRFCLGLSTGPKKENGFFSEEKLNIHQADRGTIYRLCSAPRNQDLQERPSQNQPKE